MNLILVTGCSGRIGQIVCRRFIENGCRVIGFDIKNPNIEGVEFIEVDLTSDKSVRRGFDHIRHKYGDRINSIIHLASYYSFSGSNTELYDKLTVRGTGRILENAKTFKTEQFLFSSTMLVYKPSYPGKKITENSTLDAKWDYPKSKIRTENLIHKLRGHIPTISLRIAGCYDNECHSIPIANEIQRIYEHQFTSRLFPGDMTHGSAYLHLDDLADAIWLAYQKRAELPEETTLLIGESRVMSYDAMQKALSKLIDGKEIRTIRVPKWVAKSGAWAMNNLPIFRSGFIEPWMIDLADDHYELDISRARLMLNWTPKHFVGNVLPSMIDFLKIDPIEFYRTNDLICPEWLKEKYKETASV